VVTEEREALRQLAAERGRREDPSLARLGVARQPAVYAYPHFEATVTSAGFCG
jgi:hypothetical protein